MGRLCLPRWRLGRLMAGLQVILGLLVITVSLSCLYRFHSAGYFLHNEDICRNIYTIKQVNSEGFDLKALHERVDEVLEKMDDLYEKLDKTVKDMEKSKDGSKKEMKKFLEDEVMKPFYYAHIGLRQIRLPKPEGIRNSTEKEEPLINKFLTEEIRKYITPKVNRFGRINMFGTERIYNTIGHACVLMKTELEKYMDYDVGAYCDDDWNLAQKLILGGCDPLPRRRCLTRASMTYQKPYSINESLWKLPDDRNVRWGNYHCRNFACLSIKNQKRGYTKCSGCFEMEIETGKWVKNSTLLADFKIDDVLRVKPGEIRIGLDSGVGTGTFAARMREKNVTIVTTALNLGAPFSEMIALRGLIPLYISLYMFLQFRYKKHK